MAAKGDLKKIEFTVAEINKKLDTLLEERETLALMSIAERSLKDFLSSEPDLYSIKDVKARHW